MLINKTTGEIAFHSIILKENGGFYVEQRELKNTKQGDEIEYIEPKYIEQFLNAKAR